LRPNCRNASSDCAVYREVEFADRRADDADQNITLLSKLKRLRCPSCVNRKVFSKLADSHEYGAFAAFIARVSRRRLPHDELGQLSEREDFLVLELV
jgi:hypothetical protein